MGKVKQLDIEKQDELITPADERPNPKQDTVLRSMVNVDSGGKIEFGRRVYLVDNDETTQKFFIMMLALELYKKTDFDIRSVIDQINKNLDPEACYSYPEGEHTFRTFLKEPTEFMFTGTNPQPEVPELRSFEISYDVTIISTIPKLFQKRKPNWKRVSEVVKATSFYNAKADLRTRFENDPQKRKIKNINLEELFERLPHDAEEKE